MTVIRYRIGETNCYLIGEGERRVLVDPGPAGAAGQLMAELGEAGVRPSDIGLLFITHAHWDHYGAAAEVQAWCGAPVVSHPAGPGLSQEKRFAFPPAQTLRGSILRWAYLMLASKRLDPFQSDATLEDGDSLAGYGVDARVIGLPGHSVDSLGLAGPEGELIVGDLYVNYTVPSRPLYLSDGKAWDRSHEKVVKLAPLMIYIGHGEPFAGDKLAHIYPSRYQWRWWVR